MMDPFKANINLTANQLKSQVGIASAIYQAFNNSLPEPATTSGTSEGEIAFTNPNTSAKYLKLREKGLNNLRAEIVSACEFVPLRPEINELNTSIMFRQGNNAEVSVSNVVRLIELHRQIRVYMHTAAEKVLQEVYPNLYETSFINKLKNYIKTHAQTAIDPSAENVNISTIVNNYFSIARQTVSTSGDSEFLQRFINNQSNAFLLAAVEYIVGEILIENVIGYLASISALPQKFSNHWSIFSVPNLSSYLAIRSDHAFNNPALELFFNGGSTGGVDIEPSFVPAKDLSLLFDDTTSNTDEFMQISASIQGAINLKDSSTKFRKNRNQSETLDNVTHNQLRVGLESDLCKSLNELKKVKLQGLFMDYRDGVEEDLFNGDSTNSQYRGLGVSPPNSGNNLSDARLSEIFSVDSAELMAALCFDMNSYVVNKVQKGLSTDKKLLKSNQLMNKTAISSTILNRLRSLLAGDQFATNGENVVSERLNLGVTDENNPGVYGQFGKAIVYLRDSGRLTDDEKRIVYSAIETSGKEEVNSFRDETLIDYQTAVDYLVRSKIEQTDFSGGATPDFTELRSFAEEYFSLSSDLLESILTVFPLPNITENFPSNSIQNLAPYGSTGSPAHIFQKFLAIAYEEVRRFWSADNRREKIYNLAALLRQGVKNDENAFRRNFLIVFLDRLLAHGVFFDSDQGFNGFEESSSPDPHKTREALGHLLNYLYESEFRDFMEEECNQNFHSSAVTRKPNRGRSEFPLSGKTYSAPLAEAGDAFIISNILERTVISGDPRNYNEDGVPTLFTVDRDDLDAFADHALGTRNVDYALSKEIQDKVIKGSNTTGIAELFNKCIDYVIANGLVSEFPSNADVPVDSVFSGLGIDFSDLQIFSDDSYIFHYKESDADYLSSYDEDLVKERFLNGSLGENGGKSNVSIRDLGVHHRMLIAFRFMHDILYDSINVYAENISGTTRFEYDLHQLYGVSDAFLAASEIGMEIFNGKSTTNLLNSYNENNTIASRVYRQTKNSTFEKIMKVFERIKLRQEKMIQLAMMYRDHSAALLSVVNKVENVLQGKRPDGTLNGAALAGLQTLAAQGLLQDSLTLNTKLTPGNIMNSLASTYKLRDDTLLPVSLKPRLAKIKLMNKFLGEPGYGFLESEKRGNKTVLQVGLTAGMIEGLQRLGVERTGNSDFIDSPYVCISVFKQDHFNPTQRFYPKNFIFDTSARILDYNLEDESEFDHVKIFDENKNISQLMNTIRISRFLTNPETGETVQRVYGNKANRIVNSAVFMNHIHDYCFKEYFKMTSGLDFNEDTYLLSENTINYLLVNPSNYLGDSVREEYIKVLSKIERLYPDFTTNQDLANEVFRLSEVLKHAAPFSYANNFKKVIQPNSFDRIYSVFVNEKDFIPVTNTPLNEIFQAGSVKFGMNAKLQRPDNFRLSFEDKLGSGGLIEQQNPDLYKYALSTKENFPGVYQYYVTVSVLPLGFVENATRFDFEGEFGSTSSNNTESSTQSFKSVDAESQRRSPSFSKGRQEKGQERKSTDHKR